MIQIFSDIPAVTDFESQGKRLYQKMEILHEKDVDYSQLPTIVESAEERSMSALTLKQGATGWKEFWFAKYTLGATSEGSSGDITSTVTNQLQGTIGGDSIAIDNLLQQIGVPCFLKVTDRFNGKVTIYGRPYSPMFLSAFSKRKNADNTSADVTFSQESMFQPLEYIESEPAPEPEPDED